MATDSNIFQNAEPVELDVSDRAGGTGEAGTTYYGICQRMSRTSKIADNPGKFHHKDDEGEIVIDDLLKVVILDSASRRTRFSAEGSVACRSNDGYKGQSGYLCETCEFSAFNRESKIDKDLRCKSSMLLLCLDAENQANEPFFLQITAGGIKDYRIYAAEIQNRYKRPLFSCVTKILTIERVGKSTGKSFVPVFTAIKPFGVDETNLMREIRISESTRFRGGSESDRPIDTEHSDPETQDNEWEPIDD